MTDASYSHELTLNGVRIVLDPALGPDEYYLPEDNHDWYARQLTKARLLRGVELIKSWMPDAKCRNVVSINVGHDVMRAIQAAVGILPYVKENAHE